MMCRGVPQAMRPLLALGFLVGTLTVGSLSAVGQDDQVGVSSSIDVPTGEAWTDTGLQVAAGDQVRVITSGSSPMGPSAPAVTPAGVADCTPNPNFVAPDLPCYALIGRIGESAPFLIGPDATFNVNVSGQVFLGVNDDFFPDNEGIWQASILVISPDEQQTAGVGETAATPSTLDVPASPNAPANPAATEIPSADHPVALIQGSCEEPGPVVAALGTTASPSGDVVGQALAVPAETVGATVPISLETLLASDHAVTISSSSAENAPILACGGLGTEVGETGDIVIGLRQAGDSGYTGIAYLAPIAVEPGSTAVTVFAARGLGEEQAQE